jgi:hypothetical protein
MFNAKFPLWPNTLVAEKFVSGEPNFKILLLLESMTYKLSFRSSAIPVGRLNPLDVALSAPVSPVAMRVVKVSWP